MFSTRRLAKRSIVGTRVCAPWNDDRFYPGVIQSTQTWPNGEDVYTVLFDDGYSKTFRDKELIGPGFQTINVARLKFGQKVYITHNGREVCGKVVKHEQDLDDVVIEVSLSPGEEVSVARKLDDVRMIESRKSARLQDQDTDYSRLIDPIPEPTKKRAVSHVIDVPVPAAKQSRRRKSSPSSEKDEEDMVCDEEEVEEQRGPMDARMAAMVLTTLSCSPVSPGNSFPPSITEKEGSSPSGTTGSSIGSSGVWGLKSEPSTPSPPQNALASGSAPPAPVFGLQFPPDEGIELDDSASNDTEDGATKKKKISTRTVFQCTWPGCVKLFNTVTGIEKHVRHSHLGPKDDSDVSDHEEEFYYTEVEVTVDTVTQSFADLHTSSPPQCSAVLDAMPPSTHTDHDYQKKSSPLNIPRNSHTQHHDYFRGASFPLSADGNTAAASPRSWQFSFQGPSPSIKITKPQDRSHSHVTKSHFLSSSPKSSPMHKKSRSDIKKCRKIYGMENRDLWCTQCKWKKACTRFQD